VLSLGLEPDSDISVSGGENRIPACDRQTDRQSVGLLTRCCAL